MTTAAFLVIEPSGTTVETCETLSQAEAYITAHLNEEDGSDGWRVVHTVTTEPECPYCGTTEGLRITGDGGLSAFGFQLLPTEYTCEDCFTGTDDGPSFDDLPAV